MIICSRIYSTVLHVMIALFHFYFPLHQIVGAAPPPGSFGPTGTPASTIGNPTPAKGPVEKKKGALLQWLEESEKEKEENEQRKREKMNEIYMARMLEKQAAADKAKQQQQQL